MPKKEETLAEFISRYHTFNLELAKRLEGKTETCPHCQGSGRVPILGLDGRQHTDDCACRG